MRGYPNDIETEKKLLSAMMLKNGAVIPQVADIVTADDFYRPEHRRIFRAMLNIYDKGTPPDIPLIEDELKRTGALAGIDRSYLFSLMDMEFTTARAETQAALVKEKANLRKLIELSEILQEKARAEKTSSEQLLAELEGALMEQHTKSSTSLESSGKILADVYKRATELSNIVGMTGITTGFLSLNKITDGLQKSDLIILAARPSMGKTALALNIAQNAALKNAVVAIFSMEMSKSQLGVRLLSTMSGVVATKINSGKLEPRDFGKMIDALQVLGSYPVYIDDTSGLSVSKIRAKAKHLQKEQGLDLVVIDYLQLMRGRGENRVQEISEISRELKGLAKELNVPVLALSQLSRQVEMRAEKKPQLSDLRDSGSIEQDADVVMFLYRDEYYNHDDPANQNVAELIVAKNRNGSTGAVRLYFQKEIMRFGDLTQNSEVD